MCEFCGANFSPEWRRGPNGSNTLCNACGIKYAKRRRNFFPDIKGDDFSEAFSLNVTPDYRVGDSMGAHCKQVYGSCPQFLSSESPFKSEISLSNLTPSVDDPHFLRMNRQGYHRPQIEVSEPTAWNSEDALFPYTSSKDPSQNNVKTPFEF